jgi:Domain of unknown function (DUF2017)
MSGFSRHRRSGHYFATFSGLEADLLRSLASQLVELLRNEAAVPHDHADPLEAMLSFDGPTTAPDDPVLARLFPTAYADDDEAAAEFRRFTEGSLRNGKAAGAAAVIDTLEEAGLPADLAADPGVVIDVELDQDAAMVWVRTFTDLRLALGTRLEVEQDDDAYWDSLPDDDQRAQAHHIYQWVGYLQESLVDALHRA